MNESDDLAHELEAQLALANEAVAVVLADLQRTTEMRPDVAVDVWGDSGVRITVNRGYTAPSMWETDRAEARAEVATYLQDQLDLGDWWKDEPVDRSGCWPVCASHDALMLAAVDDGVAVWWCAIGEHAAADVGSLQRTQCATPKTESGNGRRPR